MGPGATTPRRLRGAGGFALPAGGATRQAAAMARPDGVAALLAVQDGGAPPAMPAEAGLRRADRLLEDLRGLQLDLLRGTEDPARLARLETLARGAGPIEDPALREALAGISLRARLELARRRPPG
jgi:hypothetical protein